MSKVIISDKLRTVRSRAPVRICDLGGWTDTWFCSGGAVLNMAVDLYTHVRLVENNDGRVRIVSEDLELRAEYDATARAVYDGTLDILKAAANRLPPGRGADMYVRADAPPGSGVGTSASVAVAALGALAKFRDENPSPNRIAKLAHALETEELKLQSGVQDQYAAAHGGICFMEIDYPEVRLSHVPVAEKTVCELEERLVLVYLGTRSSNVMHLRVVERYEAADRTVRGALRVLAAAARDTADALAEGDLDATAALMNRNWAAQQQLHPDMATPAVQAAQVIALANGAAGFKVNGAGGGGSAAILAKRGRELQLIDALKQNGIPVLPCKLNFSGLQAWE